MTPTIAIHLTAALGALMIGPFAIWARRGSTKYPTLHRYAGYSWVSLMVLTCASAMFIRDYRMPNIAGYTPIHLLVIPTLASLAAAFYFLFVKRNIKVHEKIMVNLYIGACVITGALTLLPGRYLGNLLWR